MKKYIILLAAVVAALTLCSATAGLAGTSSDGTVRFESSSMPALNFTMPVSQAESIYRLMPESVTALCTGEYGTVRGKCIRSSSFTHKGVKVTRTGDSPSMTIALSFSGYRLTVSGVSWEELDALFGER